MPYNQEQKNRYFAIKAALTRKEKELIQFYDLQWILRHRVPTIEEVATQIKQSQVSVNYYLARAPVIKALDQRGIPWRQHSQTELTATQVAAAVTVMNFTDTRSNDEKLDQLGILPATYYAWLNDPQFKNLIDSLADQNLKHIRPAAIAEFTKLVNKGDRQAIIYYLETTGALKSDERPQSEQLLMMIVEVIQKHVTDPKIMVAIAEEMQAVFHNRTLEVVNEQPAITGEYSENDPELERARKMLGV